jgi:hypothetical protein
MFTIVLGVNPINMTGVDRNAGNILRALIEFMPGGTFITEALDNHGTSSNRYITIYFFIAGGE